MSHYELLCAKYITITNKPSPVIAPDNATNHSGLIIPLTIGLVKIPIAIKVIPDINFKYSSLPLYR